MAPNNFLTFLRKLIYEHFLLLVILLFKLGKIKSDYEVNLK